MAKRQITVTDLVEVARSLDDLRERVERLERLAADRAHPLVVEAATVVDDALMALARTADLRGDEPAA